MADTFVIGADSSDPIKVQRMGFGAMRITGPGIWGNPANREAALRVLRRAVELGVDFIDTADSYGPFVSEDLIAEALHPYENVVIATKGGLTRQGPDRWHPVGNPYYLEQALEMSLRRLKVETIDLYQLHRIDQSVPLEDQLGVLFNAQRAGKIRHIGVSEVSVDQLHACLALGPIATVQNLYNVANRSAEDVYQECVARGIGFIPWFPMGGRELAQADSVLASVARRLGATSAQVALAWLLSKDDAMLPIPGTGSLAHLEENMQARALTFSVEDLAELETLGTRTSE
jgi:aryl-alcohol dehydrogenase-like predicted oxidoreductase